MNIVLLGDGLLAPSSGAANAPSVVAQLDQLLDGTGHATPLADSQSCTTDILSQTARISAAANHVVLGAGLSEAMENLRILDFEGSSVLSELDRILVDFERSYIVALDAVLQAQLPTLVLTVHNGRFRLQTPRVRTIVRLFNDVIIGIATYRSLPVIDLRRICDDDLDFVNPVDLSARGAAKVAETILRVLHSGKTSHGSALLPAMSTTDD